MKRVTEAITPRQRLASTVCSAVAACLVLAMFLAACGGESGSVGDATAETSVADVPRTPDDVGRTEELHIDRPDDQSAPPPDASLADGTDATLAEDFEGIPEPIDLPATPDLAAADQAPELGAPDGPPPCTPGCPANLDCGPFVDECGTTQDCGKCSPPKVCGGGGVPNQCGVPQPLPYPAKTAYQVKGIQPDHWPDKQEIAGNGTGSVAMNLVWYGWEPSVKPPPCGDGEQEFDGHCFVISGGVDSEIREYTEKGVVVTAVVYGVPEWARKNVACSPVAPGFEGFCKPDNPSDYARFAGMLAFRYNGLNGNGRIADFVIHNEVNSNDWFDVGCGQGAPCDPNSWIQIYADNYAAAYDAITLQQPHAKVLMSFTHHFDTTFDMPSAGSPLLSVKTFVSALAPKLGGREWRVAYHPYPPDLLKPQFGPDDLPRVTYGNIGVTVGWLMAAFPDHPHAWDVELTESGVNSLGPGSSPQAQADGVCKSLYNVVGTPGISNYIYHRMKDHPAETAGGLGLGMVTESGDFKPAWPVWALANRIDLNPPKLACGFENLPFTKLVRGYKAGRGHWASTRILPDGMVPEQAFRLHREPQPSSIPLFECMVGNDSFVSKEQSCEGQQPMGPLGYISTQPFDGAVALYRCFSKAAGDHMISPDPNCESYETEHLLGYAQPW